MTKKLFELLSVRSSAVAASSALRGAVLLTTAAAFLGGASTAFAQGAPPGLVNPQYGAPWVAKRITEQNRIADNETTTSKMPEHGARMSTSAPGR